MNRLTFGVRCSPYVATQVIRHLAETHAESHPTASKAILTSFYVDDYLSGASTVAEAVRIRTELCDLLNIAGMTLRKWRSSNDSFKSTIPTDIIETENPLIAPTDKPMVYIGIFPTTISSLLHRKFLPINEFLPINASPNEPSPPT